MAKDWVHMLPRSTQSRRGAKSFLKVESHLYIADSPNNEVGTQNYKVMNTSAREVLGHHLIQPSHFTNQENEAQTGGVN